MNLRLLGQSVSLVALLGGILGIGGAAQAQVVTNIAPDVAAGRTTGTTTSISGAVTTIDGGTLVGTNLFHSFTQFDLASGAMARWDRAGGGAASVTRLINRVTGGNLSSISGELNTTAFANADFYFINPAGFIFGDGFNAQVPGAFHISTSNQLNFADGAVFSATTPSGSTLTLAEPSSFGFLGSASGDIVFRTTSPTTVSIALSDALSLSAADIEFDGLHLYVEDAATMISAVGEGSASIPLGAAGLPSNLTGEVRARSGGVSGALVDASTNAQGGIAISARTLSISDRDGVQAGGFSTGNFTSYASGDIVVYAEDILLAGRAEISSSVGAAALGQGANVSLNVGNSLTISGSGNARAPGASISSHTDGAGVAGNIAINAAGAVVNMNGGYLSGFASNAAAQSAVGASVVVDASELYLRNGGGIGTGTQGAAASGGITINTGLLEMSGGQNIIGAGAFGNLVLSTGSAGAITINANEFRSLAAPEANQIITNTFGSGDAGAILLNVRDSFTTQGLLRIDSASNAGATGGAGKISVLGNTAVFDFKNDIISVETNGPGRSGDINIAAREVRLAGTQISASSTGAGDAGRVSVSATGGSLSATQSTIQTVASGTGAAGAIDLTATGSMFLTDTSISSQALNSARRAGRISATAGSRIDMLGAAISIESSSSAPAILAPDPERPGAFLAPQIAVSAPLLNLGNARLATATSGVQRGGGIVVSAGAMRMTDSSLIDFRTTGAANGGDLSIDVSSLLMQEDPGGPGNLTYMVGTASGSGAGGSIVIRANTLDMLAPDAACQACATSVSTGTNGSGKGGDILFLIGDRMNVQNGFIGAGTGGTGAGGATRILGDRAAVVFAGLSNINNSSGALGRAGDIEIAVRAFDADNGQLLSFSNNIGRSGDIDVRATDIRFVNDSNAVTRATGSGGGGNIAVSGARISFERGSDLISETNGAGAGGQIRVSGSESVLVSASGLNASSSGSGPGGSIHVGANELILNQGSGIDAGARGAGRGGDIAIDASIATIGDSSVTSGTTADGAGGSITIAGDSLVVDRGRIGAGTTGAGAAGSVALNLRSDALLRNGSVVSSESGVGAAGVAGAVTVGTAIAKIDTLRVLTGSSVETTSRNAQTAGAISVFARDVIVDGMGSEIVSENIGTGAAGNIIIDVDPITVSNGGRISTNSLLGAAGNITLNLPSNGLLFLNGANPGVITTSSGPGVGGKITISNPLAIIADGSQILALGQAGGANVSIDAGFFIRSADGLNLLSVDGSLVLDSQVQDVSSGTETADVAFLDASRVLSGQCPAVRERGESSQLSAPRLGPFAIATLPSHTSILVANAGPPAMCR